MRQLVGRNRFDVTAMLAALSLRMFQLSMDQSLLEQLRYAVLELHDMHDTYLLKKSTVSHVRDRL